MELQRRSLSQRMQGDDVGWLHNELRHLAGDEDLESPNLATYAELKAFIVAGTI